MNCCTKTNKFEHFFLQDFCIHQLFEKQAACTPNNVAVVYENQQLTYRELNLKANQVASYMRKQYKNIFYKEFAPETLVGLVIDRGIAMIVGVLGILKAGGAYVPIDPEAPEERLKFIVADAGLQIILTKKKELKKLARCINVTERTECAVICLDQDDELIIKESSENIAEKISSVAPTNLAYVIYTSGSTGKPKGVLIEHRNVVRLFAATQKQFKFNEKDVWTMFHSFAFDFSVWEIWGALLYGGKLVVVPYWISRTSEEFYELARREKVTVLNQTPAAFSQFIKVDATSLHKLSSLRYVIFGGEELILTNLQPWIEKYGLQQPQLVNMYGITETTVHVTCLFLCSEDFTRAWRSPIGGCIEDLFAYVIDENGKEVAVDEVGELYVGGAGVARGYLNRPKLTQEKFITDFAVRSNARVYKTGDAVRKLSDGKFDYISRVDNQVKIRGFRIELGEIEAVLRKFSDIEQCFVVVRDVGEHKQLVGYYVTRESVGFGKVGSKDLFEHLKKHLPSHMMPAYLIELKAMPLTINGKINKNALPQPNRNNICTKDNYVAPATDNEKILVAIWCDVLKLEKVSVADNFFALGGDSIHCIQIVSRARDQGLHFTTQQLLNFPTIAALAGQVETKAMVVVGDQKVYGEVLIGPIQKRYFKTTHKNYNTFYQASLIFLEHILNIERVELLLEKLILQHDILRAHFVHDSKDQWTQLIPATTVKNNFYCEKVLVKNSNIFCDENFLVGLRENLQSKLNIEKGLLLCAALLVDHDNKHAALLLLIHHLVIDGVSWRILHDDIKTMVKQSASSLPLSLPIKTTSMQNCTKALYAYLPKAEQEWDYWLGVSKNASMLKQNVAKIKKAINKDIKHLLFTLDEQVTYSLFNEIALKYHTQINDILLTALLLAVNSWSNVDDVLVQLEGHGREEVFAESIDFSRTVGWFTSFFPVHLRLPSNWHVLNSLGAVIKHVKETLRSIPNKGVGYAVLRFLSDDPRAQILDELEDRCNICFNYLGVLDSAVYEADIAENQVNTNAQLFEINAWVMAEKFHMDIAYNSNIFCYESAQEFTGLIKMQLENIIDFCCKEPLNYYTPSDFPLANVNQNFLDKLAVDGDAIENIYALTPLQYGFIFHSLYAPTSDQYCVQIHWRCTVDLDVLRLIKAWELLIKQHEVLRTAFVWEGVIEPVQIVYENAVLDWDYEDWSSCEADDIDKQLENFLCEERNKNFDLTMPCLMRFHVIYLGKNKYELIWSSHHIIFDGWCVPLIFKNLQENYTRLAYENNGASLCFSSAPYKNYLVWLKDQDKTKAEKFWQSMLCGIKAPTALSSTAQERFVDHKPIVNITRQKFVFNEELQIQATLFVQKRQVTLSALLQFVWAIILAKYSRCDDVVFGAVFSGRSEEVKQVENIVGLFINTLPIRIRLEQHESCILQIQDFFRKIQDINQFSYLSLHEVKRLSDVPKNNELFYTIFDFENIPDCSSAKGESLIFDLSSAVIWEKTNYPLVINVLMQEKLTLVFSYDADVFAFSAIEDLINNYIVALEWLLLNAEKNLIELNFQDFAKYPQVSQGYNKEDDIKNVNNGQDELKDYYPPNTQVEKILVKIWQDLLQIDLVGIRDNFFSLGGDSIISIQMVSRARESGLYLTIKDLFLHSKIEDLAKCVVKERQFFIDQGSVHGQALLTPIQQWFFAQNFPSPNHYNQSFLLKFDEKISLEVVREIFTFLVSHHDALRLRFKKNNNGYTQFYSDDYAVDVMKINLPHVADHELIKKVCGSTQAALNVENGPILKVVLFTGDTQDCICRLFIVIHHLVIDGVSWRILFEDFAHLYELIKEQKYLCLPNKTSSYAVWGKSLKNYLETIRPDLDYWLAIGKNADAIPCDIVADKLLNAGKKTLFIELNKSDTGKLLKDFTSSYHAQINDILLAIMLLAFQRWRDMGNLLIDLEGHGRESCIENVDISRTTGWFTNIYPVYFDITKVVKEVNYFGAIIKYVKEVLRSIKDKGMAYGVLKYLADEQTTNLFKQARQAEILFNYLGIIDSQQQLFAVCPVDFNFDIDNKNKLAYLMEFNAFVLDGKFKIFLDYQSSRFKESSMASLMSVLQTAINDFLCHCIKNDQADYSPTDFNLDNLSQKSLDFIMQQNNFVANTNEPHSNRNASLVQTDPKCEGYNEEIPHE